MPSPTRDTHGLRIFVRGVTASVLARGGARCVPGLALFPGDANSWVGFGFSLRGSRGGRVRKRGGEESVCVMGASGGVRCVECDSCMRWLNANMNVE